MTHDNRRTVKGLDGLLQHVLRRHVEMVGRLVKNQQVDWFQQQTDHRQTTALTTAKHFNLLVALLTTKHKGSKDIVNSQADLALGHIVNSLEHCETLVEQLSLILGEVAYLDIMTDFQFTSKGNLTHDTFHERRFSLAVLTYEGHFLASLDGQRHMVENGVGSIVLSYIIADNRIVATSQTRRKLQVHR